MPDTTAPTGALGGTSDGNNIVITPNGGSAGIVIYVKYRDDVAVKFSTIGNTNIEVTGPSAFDQYIPYDDSDISIDGPEINVTYSLPTALDPGIYTVLLKTGVTDTSSNGVPAATLGYFIVFAQGQVGPYVVSSDGKHLGPYPVNNGHVGPYPVNADHVGPYAYVAGTNLGPYAIA